MKITIYRAVSLSLLFLLLLSFIGCGGSPRQVESVNESRPERVSRPERDTYTLEEFQREMRQKGYPYEIQDAEKDFIPGERKRLKLGDKEAVAIFLFGSKQEMETVAKNIDHDGGGYNDGKNAICIDYAYSVNYYKMGTLIVRYVGENSKINSDLTDIFGEPFAGSSVRFRVSSNP